MAKTVKTNQLPVVNDLTGAKIIGLTAEGVDAQFPLANIVRSEKGVATPATVPPGQRFAGETWPVSTAHLDVAYPGFGGITVTSKVGEKYTTNNRFVWNNGVWEWQKELVEVPNSSTKDWISQSYSSGSQVFYQGTLYEANSNAVGSEVPGISPKWTAKTNNEALLQQERTLLNEVKGAIEIVTTGQYLTKTNALSPIANARISNTYRVIPGSILLYTGRYGQAAVAVLFFNDAGSIVGFIENTAAQISVTDLEILVPVGATIAKFCSLNDVLKVSFFKDSPFRSLSSRVGLNEASIINNTNSIKTTDDRLKAGTPLLYDGSISGQTTTNTGGFLIGCRDVLPQDFILSSIRIKITAIINEGNFPLQVYAVSGSNVILRSLPAVNVTNVAVNDIVTVPVNALFNSGERFYLGAPVGVKTMYGVVPTGFKFRSFTGSDTGLGLVPGNSTGVPQDFATGSPIGVSGRYLTGEYVDFTQFAKTTDVTQLIASAISNRLSGKKIVAIGDSMVRGHSLSIGLTWPAMIAGRNNMTVINYGINGNKLTNTGGTGTPLVLRYSEMDSDADYVVIFIGTNDASVVTSMGTDDSILDTEFKGALNILCNGLITRYPTAKILFITPYIRNANFPPYITAIETICAKYGIKVFNNAKEGGVYFQNTAQAASLTLGDGLHLNAAGMLYASHKYEHVLKSL